MPLRETFVAMVWKGPAAPERERARSSRAIESLSVAVKLILKCSPSARTSPPFGEVRVTAGGAISTNVGVTVLLASIVRFAGLVEPLSAPLQPVKFQPGPGFAVSWTIEPSGWADRF